MGLDICLHRMGKVDHSKTYTFKEFEREYIGDKDTLCTCKEIPSPQKVFVGLSPEYFAKVIVPIYDESKLLASKGKSVHDRWEWTSTSFGSDEHECKEEFPPNEDDLICCIKFARHDDSTGKEIEHIWIVVTKDNEESFITPVEYWYINIIERDIGYMRKGANSKFYEDGNWDNTAKTRVFSKEVLKEHMEKYFDESGNGSYSNPRAVFKEQIFDKFKDGEGMFVSYC